MMDFTSIIKTVAPWIGTALAGPLGGMALTAASGALGLPDATTASLKQALSGVTPEQMLALKTADQSFALQMQELGYKEVADIESIAAGDRKDARATRTLAIEGDRLMDTATVASTARIATWASCAAISSR